VVQDFGSTGSQRAAIFGSWSQAVCDLEPILLFQIKVPGHRNYKGGWEQKWNHMETRGTDTHRPTLFSLAPPFQSVYQQQSGCEAGNTYCSFVNTTLVRCCSIDSAVSYPSVANQNHKTDQWGDCNSACGPMSGNPKLKEVVQARLVPGMVESRAKERRRAETIDPSYHWDASTRVRSPQQAPQGLYELTP